MLCCTAPLGPPAPEAGTGTVGKEQLGLLQSDLVAYTLQEVAVPSWAP